MTSSQSPRAIDRCRRRVASSLIVALLVGTGVLASGCTSPRDTLGTAASPCFRVLAVVTDELRGAGHFAGVRVMTLGALAQSFRRVTPRIVDVPRRIPAPKTRVCVVAFRGTFTTSMVARGWPVDATTGTIALVVVRLSDERLLDTLVIEKPPIAFSRVFPLVR